MARPRPHAVQDERISRLEVAAGEVSTCGGTLGLGFERKGRSRCDKGQFW